MTKQKSLCETAAPAGAACQETNSQTKATTYTSVPERACAAFIRRIQRVPLSVTGGFATASAWWCWFVVFIFLNTQDVSLMQSMTNLGILSITGIEIAVIMYFIFASPSPPDHDESPAPGKDPGDPSHP